MNLEASKKLSNESINIISDIIQHKNNLDFITIVYKK